MVSEDSSSGRWLLIVGNFQSGNGLGTTKSMGVSFLEEADEGRIDAATPSLDRKSCWKPCMTGSAVFGLGLDILCSGDVSNSDLPILTVGGLDVPALTMDVILPVTEWLARAVDRLLEVSEDIVDSGRGMYSTVSAKPT